MKENQKELKKQVSQAVNRQAFLWKTETLEKGHGRIEIVWLPTYSPNLNLIERLWKFFKKKVLKNKFYGTAKGFREKVEEFFKNIKNYKSELENLLTCNFGVVKFSQSFS